MPLMDNIAEVDRTVAGNVVDSDSKYIIDMCHWNHPNHLFGMFDLLYV